jgi:hypothetical protein
LCATMLGWVMIRARFSLNLPRGTPWWFVGNGTHASLAPSRTN